MGTTFTVLEGDCVAFDSTEVTGGKCVTSGNYGTGSYPVGGCLIQTQSSDYVWVHEYNMAPGDSIAIGNNEFRGCGDVEYEGGPNISRQAEGLSYGVIKWNQVNSNPTGATDYGWKICDYAPPVSREPRVCPFRVVDGNCVPTVNAEGTCVTSPNYGIGNYPSGGCTIAPGHPNKYFYMHDYNIVPDSDYLEIRDAQYSGCGSDSERLIVPCNAFGSCSTTFLWVQTGSVPTGDTDYGWKICDYPQPEGSERRVCSTMEPSSPPSVSLKPSSPPSDVPSVSSEPSALPSREPSISSQPSVLPSNEPSVSLKPSALPSNEPSVSLEPSALPSNKPSASLEPSALPSNEPSVSNKPSALPSNEPSFSSEPSVMPSDEPTFSVEPSVLPSSGPSFSVAPSSSPTFPGFCPYDPPCDLLLGPGVPIKTTVLGVCSDRCASSALVDSFFILGYECGRCDTCPDEEICTTPLGLEGVALMRETLFLEGGCTDLCTPFDTVAHYKVVLGYECGHCPTSSPTPSPTSSTPALLCPEESRCETFLWRQVGTPLRRTNWFGRCQEYCVVNDLYALNFMASGYECGRCP